MPRAGRTWSSDGFLKEGVKKQQFYLQRGSAVTINQNSYHQSAIVPNDDQPGTSGKRATEEYSDVLNEFGFYSYSHLTDEDKKPPEFLIEGMIPVGMTFLSGPPKTRKSFMALQMAVAVATGTPFFGHQTRLCEVAYFDLEGSKSRIADRVRMMPVKPPDSVHITNSTKWHLGSGALVSKIRDLHQQHPGIRLVIIDTYSRARGRFQTGGANAYDADVQLLEGMQRMAIEENISVLFIHHDKKGASNVNDDFERLSGTMGISGSADCVINLIPDGERTNGRARLVYTPRDARGGEMELVFDASSLEWQEIISSGGDVRQTAVGGWIIQHAPEPQRDGVFFDYQTVFLGAYFGVATDGQTAAEKIREQVKKYREDLFMKYSIGVQLGVKSNGKRGIRIFNLQ